MAQGNLLDAFKYASQNPNSDFANNLRELAKSGSLNVEAKKYGIDLSPFGQDTKPQQDGFFSSLVKDPINTLIVNPAVRVGQAVNSQIAKGQYSDIGDQVVQMDNFIRQKQTDIQNNPNLTPDQKKQQIADLLNKAKQGSDYFTQQLNTNDNKMAMGLSGGANYEAPGGFNVAEQKRGVEGAKQIAGQGLMAASYLVGGEGAAATGSNAVKDTFMAATKSGVKAGAISGGLAGAGDALNQNGGVADVINGTITGGLSGGVVGGILGGGASLISKGVKGAYNAYTDRGIRGDIINAQSEAGIRPTLEKTITEKAAIDPRFRVLVQEAEKQGFSPSDVNFLATVSDSDKPTLNKMYNLTVKAQSDPRQIVRAADVLGTNVKERVDQIVGLNKKAGVAVDKAAKALQGQAVDVEPLRTTILSKLDNAGIQINPDGTLDFSNSVFKNIPSIQNELQKVIATVPDGSDAYQLHIFKKTLDEMVNFGTAGEGLTGSASTILKSIRNATDSVLDNSFASYNEANNAFKMTREFIDQAKALVGKKIDLTSEEGAQAFGQALRSAFSNNKSRPLTLKFIEDAQILSKQLGLKGADKNLLDQALFVNMLEDNFGSQASTGLAGEVTKGVKKAQALVQGIRNPVKGALDLVASGAEKMQNITPEAKKQVLKAFIQGSTDIKGGTPNFLEKANSEGLGINFKFSGDPAIDKPKIKQILDLANKEKPEYLQNLKSISDKYGLIYPAKNEKNAVKDLESTFKKASNPDKEGKVFSDPLRATLIINSESDVVKIKKSLKNQGYKILEEDNKFKNNKTGYGDIGLKLIKGENDPVIKELQLNTYPMVLRKNSGGHQMYKEIDALKKEFKKATPKEREALQSAIDEKVAEMNKFYDEARK